MAKRTVTRNSISQDEHEQADRDSRNTISKDEHEQADRDSRDTISEDDDHEQADRDHDTDVLQTAKDESLAVDAVSDDPPEKPAVKVKPPVTPPVEKPSALAQGNQSLQAGGNLQVLHWNVGFECMSGVDTGSGEVAAIHCQPGYWNMHAPHSLDPAANWAQIPLTEDTHGVIQGYKNYLGANPFAFQKDPKVAEQKLTDKYATSCTRNWIHNLDAWGREMDFVTFVELCNPGTNKAKGGSGMGGWSIDTSKWGTGFKEDGAVGADGKATAKYGMRQCSLLTFHKISQIYPYNEYEYHINMQPGNYGAAVQQLSIFKKSTFGGDVVPLYFQICPGRPATALIFPEKKVMLLNIHSVHLRKALMQPGNAGDVLVGGKYVLLKHACKWVKAYKGKKLAEFAKAHKRAGRIAYQKIEGWDCNLNSKEDVLAIWNPKELQMQFSQAQLSTEDLQNLFGSFLEAEITEAATGKVDLAGIDRIIAAGDFNDELHELTTLPILGKTLTITEGMTKRTCCSDREGEWVGNYLHTKEKNAADFRLGEAQVAGGQKKYGDKDYRVPAGFSAHAASNQEYLKAMYGEGAENVFIEGGPERGSNYPFASDLILDSAEGGPVEGLFIPGAGLPGVVGFPGPDAVISDHDPITARLQPL